MAWVGEGTAWVGGRVGEDVFVEKRREGVVF